MSFGINVVNSVVENNKIYIRKKQNSGITDKKIIKSV